MKISDNTKMAASIIAALSVCTFVGISAINPDKYDRHVTKVETDYMHGGAYDPQEDDIYLSEYPNEPVDGMVFSTENMTYRYEVPEDGAWVISYTDPDAGFDECEICVDLYTYEEVGHYVDARCPMSWNLYESEEPGVWTVNPAGNARHSWEAHGEIVKPANK